jgi:hypothetical protein
MMPRWLLEMWAATPKWYVTFWGVLFVLYCLFWTWVMKPWR